MDRFFNELFALLQKILFLAFILAIYVAYCYNKLQKLGQGVKSANATVLTVIQKRADLANKLMDIAKDYGNHEKLVHISISNNLMDTFKQSTVALSNVNTMAQHYPELKANQAYQQLMQQLHTIETELQQKREIYNQFAEKYNSERLQIPTVFFADFLGFSDAPYFDFDNLQEIKEFKTDDGQLLKEMLANASSKAMDLTQKGVDKVQAKLQKNNDKTAQGNEPQK